MRPHILLPLVLAACGSPELASTDDAASESLGILYSSRIDGEIEPCG